METGVDRLIQIVEKSGKIALRDIAKKIGISESTIQLWVDFLVEEKVLGVEYKFTTPYVFMNKKQETGQTFEDLPDIHYFKERFFVGARKKKIPESQIENLWIDHLSQAIDKQQEYFLREAKKRSIVNAKNIFLRYKKLLLSA